MKKYKSQAERQIAYHPVLLILVVAWFLILAAIPSHCAVSAPRHENSLGAVIEYTNPETRSIHLVGIGAVLYAAPRSFRKVKPNGDLYV